VVVEIPTFPVWVDDTPEDDKYPDPHSLAVALKKKGLNAGRS
jgi:hypothetical protein